MNNMQEEITSRYQFGENMVGKTVVKVGFWFLDSIQSTHNYPKPEGMLEPMASKKRFLLNLKAIQEKTADVCFYKGSHKCLLCGCTNGSREFHYNGFVWPEGLAHYVEKHDVKLPKLFVDMVIPIR